MKIANINWNQNDLHNIENILKINSELHENKFQFLINNLLGSGILIGYMSSLVPKIQNDMLVLEPGACIDKDGKIIHVEVQHPICDILKLNSFNHGSIIAIYIKGKVIESSFQDGVKVLENSFEVELDDISIMSREGCWLELGRIVVDKNNNQGIIKNARNLYTPNANEIDLRYTPKLEVPNIITYESIREMVDKLENLKKILELIANKGRIVSATNAVIYCTNLISNLQIQNLYGWKIYIMFEQFISILVFMKNENKKFSDTDLGKNIDRLKGLFDRNNTEEIHEKMDFYYIHLEHSNSFFSKLFKHIENSYTFIRDLEDIFDNSDKMLPEDNKQNIEKSIPIVNLQEKERKIEEDNKTQMDFTQKKEFIIVGRNPDKCDLVINERNISSKHLQVSYERKNFFITDLESTNYTYLNGERLMPYEKVLVSFDDDIKLAKNNSLNLNDPLIQGLKD